MTWKPNLALLDKEIIQVFDDPTEMADFETVMIQQLINDPLNRNYHVPGIGFGVNGTVAVRDKAGKVLRVAVDDPRYVSGELVFVRTGLISVRNPLTDSIETVSTDDPRLKTGELVYQWSGRVVAKDSESKIHFVRTDDPRLVTGELRGHTSGRITVKDKNGNWLSVTRDDPRYQSGELVAWGKGKTVVTDGVRTFSVDSSDPRIEFGELIPRARGWVTVRDSDGKCFNVRKDDPDFKTGKLVHNCKGFKFRVRSGDPRIQSGELRTHTKNSIWISNGSINKRIDAALKDQFLSSGWILGRLPLKPRSK
jgi:hypothetical protein